MMLTMSLENMTAKDMEDKSLDLGKGQVGGDDKLEEQGPFCLLQQPTDERTGRLVPSRYDVHSVHLGDSIESSAGGRFQ